jgi:hypothetical protein
MKNVIYDKACIVSQWQIKANFLFVTNGVKFWRQTVDFQMLHDYTRLYDLFLCAPLMCGEFSQL